MVYTPNEPKNNEIKRLVFKSTEVSYLREDSFEIDKIQIIENLWKDENLKEHTLSLKEQIE